MRRRDFRAERARVRFFAIVACLARRLYIMDWLVRRAICWVRVSWTDFRFAIEASDSVIGVSFLSEARNLMV